MALKLQRFHSPSADFLARDRSCSGRLSVHPVSVPPYWVINCELDTKLACNGEAERPYSRDLGALEVGVAPESALVR